VRTSTSAFPSCSDDDYLLEVQGVSRSLQGHVTVDGYRLPLSAGEIRGIGGSKGAGKTTVFNRLTRYLRPWAGRIHIAGDDITINPPHTIAALG
jgi:branched-chain amino acid transport system ATP-binding protein